MRITDSMMFTFFLNNLQKLNQDYARSTEQISTGKRVNRPSDDPVAMTTLLALRSETTSLSQFVSNTQNTETRLAATDSRLNDVSLTMTRILQLTEEAANETYDLTSRTGIARELEAITQELLGTANAKIGDRYIFAGTRTTYEALASVTGNPEGSVYSASSVRIQDSSGAATAAFSGTVTDTRDFNEHIHRIRFTDDVGGYELLDAESGNEVVASGTLAPGDVITVNGMELTFNGPVPTSGTVYNVLPQYAYNGTSDRVNMQVDENSFIDQNVPGTGPFGGTQPDATGAQVPGGTVFDDLVELRLALLNDDTDEIVNSLDTMNNQNDNLGYVRANLGGRLSNVRSLTTRNESEYTDLQIQVSNLENVNLAEAITNLTQSATAIRAAMQVGSNIGQYSLFNFLS